MPVNELKKAYYAGIIDGDGWVTIANGGNKKDSQIPTQRMVVGLAQCWVPILVEIQKEYGGNIGRLNRNKKNPNHRDWFNWQVANLQAKRFIEDILPYLVIKKEQAELALKWQDIKSNRHYGRGHLVTEEELCTRNKLKEEISRLKHETREYVWRNEYVSC